MPDPVLPMPADSVIRVAVAAVWLYEGLWCKVAGRGPGQLEVVQAVPRLGPRFGASFLFVLGLVEIGIGVWVLSGWWPGLCALSQTGLLVSLNSAGVLFARDRIHDPAGMLIKNAAFLVLAWTGAALQGVG